MSRTVSSTMRAALNAQETGEVAACLLTITHADLDEPIRLSTDPTERLTSDPLVYGTTSRGNDYSFVPLAVVLGAEGDDAAPTAALEVDNTDLALITAVRSVTDSALVQIEIVLASDPDTVEVDFPKMKVSAVTYDESSVRFQLEVDALFAEPFPGTSFLKSSFPSLT